MEKRYYNAASVLNSLRAFESRFNMDSRVFAARVEAGEDVPVDGFHRHAWLSFYRESQESQDALASHVARDLQVA